MPKLVEMRPPKNNGPSVFCFPDKVEEMKARGWKQPKVKAAPKEALKPKTQEKEK